MMHVKHRFGQLEQAIMDVVWRTPSVTGREVWRAMRHRRIAYTTVMTVMNRLVDQGLLTRTPGPHGAFLYRTKYTREAYARRASRMVIDELLRQHGSVAMAQFVDRIDHVPAEQLAELRRRLRRTMP